MDYYSATGGAGAGSSPSWAARPQFWIEFGLFSDGLDVPRAQDMAARQGLTQFPRFPDLPAELRLKVWEFFLAPRVVGAACLEAATADERREILLPTRRQQQRAMEVGGGERDIVRKMGSTRLGDDRSGGTRGRVGGGGRKGRRRGVPVPILLHINRETRTLGLKHYELAFSWKVPHVLAQMDIVSTSPPSSPIPDNDDEENHEGGEDGGSPPLCTSSRPPSPSTQLARQRQRQRRQRQRQQKRQEQEQEQQQQPRSSSPPGPPTWSEPRVYFNFSRDAVYLRGELEAYDPYGFNAPMTYFLRPADARRARRVAVSFGALGYGEGGPQQIFGALFHVADRFAAAQGGEVLVCVRDEDEVTHAQLGGHGGPLLGEGARGCGGGGGGSGGDGNGDSATAMEGGRRSEGEGVDGGRTTTASMARGQREGGGGGGEEAQQQQQQQAGGTRIRNAADDNVMQKIWRDWYRGSIVTSSLAKMRFVLVREEELDDHAWDLDE